MLIARLVAKLRPVRMAVKPPRAPGRLLYQSSPEERVEAVDAAHLEVDACASRQSVASAALNGCRAFVDVARPLPWVGHGSSGARASKPARPERPPCLQTPKSRIGRARAWPPRPRASNSRILVAWLAKNPATFGQHFPEIRWDSARSQGTVLLSVVWWSPPTWWR